jgi:negative regulator of sigma E activity
MECAEFQMDASALIDGELTEAERTRLEAHLQTCHECRDAVSRFENSSLQLRGLATPCAPTFITDPAMRLVRAMPRETTLPWIQRIGQFLSEPFLRPITISAMGLTAAVVLGVVVVSVQLGQNTSGVGAIATNESQISAGDPYHLAGAPEETTGYDFRNPANHGRRELGTLNDQERLTWQNGVWHHERRFGRDGWWWEVNGAWYWYERPADGSPTYVSQVRFVNPNNSDAERAAAGTAAPPAASSAPSAIGR